MLQVIHVADDAAEIVAADPGHDEIDEDDVRRHFDEGVETAEDITDASCFMPFEVQRFGHELEDNRVVIDDENFLFLSFHDYLAGFRLRRQFQVRTTACAEINRWCRLLLYGRGRRLSNFCLKKSVGGLVFRFEKADSGKTSRRFGWSISLTTFSVSLQKILIHQA
ncbi:MAG: hypothetical protein VR65_11990 [Desulfobulbaceae bacterium BRH_c16a]|nr:MAG: hypothetical protein VR65_11990 [Desulfobulbaceae bacterium BRH_c16a]